LFDRQFATLRRVVGRETGVALDDLDELFGLEQPVDGSWPTADEARERAASVLREPFRAADAPQRELLALYVYIRCLALWEKTSDHDRIRAIGNGLSDVLGESGPTDAVLGALVDEFAWLDKAMNVENAMNCSCPVDMSKKAGAVVSGTDTVLHDLDAMRDGNGPAGLLRADAEVHRTYFLAVKEIADAVYGFLIEDKRKAAARVVERLKNGSAVEAIERDRYASELRPHRETLQRLIDLADEKWLRIDDAEIVYIYPFAFADSVDPIELMENALLRGETLKVRVQASGNEHELPVNLEPTELTDLWMPRPLDQPDQPGYGGMSLHLPDVRVTSTAGIDIDFDAEVRFSNLGNHYLRVSERFPQEMEAELATAGPRASMHFLNQALRRGSSAMGKESFVCRGCREWTTFAQLADDVLTSLGGQLTEASADDGTRPLTWEPDATYHVIVVVHRFSLVDRHAKAVELASAHDAAGAVGASLLFHSIRQLATSLDEWVRYEAPAPENLLEGLGYAGELAVRTANTTVVVAPASPAWATDAYLEQAEFVASMPALLRSWERQAIAQERTREPTMRDLEIAVRKKLAVLHSPSLCRTATQREFIDRLWRAARLPELERDLEQWMTFVSAVVAAAQEERQARLEIWVQALLGVISVGSLTALFDWLNNKFDVSRPIWSWLEFGILVAVSAIVLVVILRKLRSN